MKFVGKRLKFCGYARQKRLHKNCALVNVGKRIPRWNWILVNWLAGALSELGNLRRVVYICYEFQFIPHRVKLKEYCILNYMK